MRHRIPDLRRALRVVAAGVLAVLASDCSAAAQRPDPAPAAAPTPATRARAGATRPASPRAATERPAERESAGPLVAGLTRLESDVLHEMNRARRDPRAYADLLERQLAYYDGNIIRIPGRTPIRTEEGARAVREAIRVLRRLEPVPPLGHASGLSGAARDHVRDQGRRGATGHTGSDGSSVADRVARHGAWDITLSENIAYGPATGRDVVIGLIVDDGVPDRGHRETIFDPTLRVAGVSCGEHRGYRVMCVIDYAGRFTDRAATAAAAARRKPGS